MNEANTVLWPGISGARYQYWYYLLEGANLASKPGNYIFARLGSTGWVPIYIGETEDLNDRITYHDKLDRAKTHGATHIHAHLTSGERQSRLDEETDLRRKFNTLCNDQ